MLGSGCSHRDVEMGRNKGDLALPAVDVTEAHLQALTAYLRRQSDVVLVYLFGSRACNRALPNSDVDIALLLEEHERTPLALLERRLDLAAAASEIVGASVDVVLLNRAPLLLQGRVLGDGHMLYAADKAAQVDYESHTRALYFDFLPRLQQHRDALIGAAREHAGG